MKQEPQERQSARPAQETVFEGGQQETVEILPSIYELSPSAREQGVVARVGRDRIERRVAEGRPLAAAGADRGGRARADALMAATYKIAGYFTLVLAAIALTVATGWFVTATVGR